MDEQGCTKYNQQDEDKEVYKIGSFDKTQQRDLKDNPFVEGHENWELWKAGWESA